MKLNKHNNKTQKKRWLILSMVVAIIAILVAGLFFLTLLGDKPRDSTSKQSPTAPNSTVDYTGPTESDVNESQNAKKKAEEPSTNPTPSPGSTIKTVSVAVSYADVYNNNLEVRAFINGVIEGTGMCTVTATRGDTTVTESAPAFIDVSTTQCNPVYIAQSRLSTGTWNVVVAFSSPDAHGTSETVEVVVQ